MAVKTITIDMKAYELLSQWKKPGQSFSDVVKERFSREGSVERFREVLETIEVSEALLDAVEAQIADRKHDKARRWKW